MRGTADGSSCLLVHVRVYTDIRVWLGYTLASFPGLPFFCYFNKKKHLAFPVMFSCVCIYIAEQGKAWEQGYSISPACYHIIIPLYINNPPLMTVKFLCYSVCWVFQNVADMGCHSFMSFNTCYTDTGLW